jgi:hypothetical protein
VPEKSKDRFKAKELQKGKSNDEFSQQIVANKADEYEVLQS